MTLQRDLVGYGNKPPDKPFPNGARLAISLVVNYEEGSERNHAMGDPDQEDMTEFGSYPFPPGTRNLAMESMVEYGSRVGIWRLLEMFRETGVKATIFACAVAFEQNPAVAKACVEAGHEICSHGYRWEEVFRLSEEEEREHIRLAVESFQKTTGSRPVGWYCRYGPSVNTRELVVEEGGFEYDCNAYNDDLPYYTQVQGKPWLVVPYSLEVNDFKFWSGGLVSPSVFFETAKNCFDVLYEEGATHPKMMSVGLHCRIIGKPSRAYALDQFLRYASEKEGVWFARRDEIAKWWKEQYPA